MFVNQIAVFLENKEGSLSDFATVLAKANVQIIAMSIADTQEFGILRAITKDNDKALKALKEAGFTANSTNLIGIAVDDKPGAFADVMQWFKEYNLSIEYMYSYFRTSIQKFLVLIKTSDVQKTFDMLKNKKAELLNNAKL